MAKPPDENGNPGDHHVSIGTRRHKFSHEEEECDVTILPYRRDWCKILLCFIVSVCTLGAYLLLMRWYPRLKVISTLRRCKPADSSFVWVIPDDESMTPELEVVERVSIGQSHMEHAKFISQRLQSDVFTFFSYRHFRYSLNSFDGAFHRQENADVLSIVYSRADIHRTGISDELVEYHRVVHGRNVIDIEMKNIFALFVDEVLHPFFIFQIFSIILWAYDSYLAYATCIFFISSISALASLIETRRNLVNLHKMARVECLVSVMREGSLLHNVSSTDLVPGDVMVVTDNMSMPCDVIVLTGTVIVNESMLTGESVPVVKSALPINEGCEHGLKKHTLFGGTKVIQTRRMGNDNVFGIVSTTGFDTAKGMLIRSMLFPKPTKFRFYQDSFKFIGVLSIIAVVGFGFCLYRFITIGVEGQEIFLRAADLITVVVPPALPACLTIGTAFALERLRKKGIFCISPPRVNVCGKINCFCFDKTGTLTEDGLDIHGIRPADGGDFSEDLLPDLSMASGTMMMSLACCHSLTRVNGELIGDPMDLKMFEGTGWILDEPEEGENNTMVPPIVRPPSSEKARDEFLNNLLGSGKLPEAGISAGDMPMELGIIRRFDFSSALQRMLVVAKDLASRDTYVFLKGSPEKVMDFSKPETIPSNFDSVLSIYTHNGYRVIALAYKVIKMAPHKVQKSPRSAFESDLIFLGFLIMENKLKVQTTGVIRELERANLRTLMVTGDNPYTAISVGRQCHIIDTDKRVFLGDIRNYGANGEPILSFVDIDNHRWMIDIQSFRVVNNTGDSDGGENFPYVLANNSDEDAIDMALDSKSVPLLDSHDHQDGSTTDIFPTKHCLPANVSLAMTGRAFEALRDIMDDHLMALLYLRVLIHCDIFARMSPDHKTQLVDSLSSIGYVTGMCGDGANDCGALKAAHVGVSLSEAEASIAAPFTSKQQSIECVLKVVREGRAALVTSFQCFKYMALYSMIQFITVMTLYCINSNLGDVQYLFIDLFIILPLAIFMARTGAYTSIARKRPGATLVSVVVLSSLIGQILIQAAFQLGAVAWIANRPWFVALNPDPEKNNVKCFENTTLFLMSNFQYVFVVMCFSIAKPYRKPVYTNPLFCITAVLLLGFCVYLVVGPHHYILKKMQMKTIDEKYSMFVLLAFAGGNFVTSYMYERVFIVGGLAKKCLKRRRRPKLYKLALRAKEPVTAAELE